MTSTHAVLTMPFSNVLHLPFEQKLTAARLAGIQAMSIQPQEVLAIVKQGLSLRDMRSMAEGAGVQITRLDPLCTWIPEWHPVNMDEDFVRSHDVSQQAFFTIAEALGCTEMSLNATFPAGRYRVDEVVRHYAAICRTAADHGMRCDLEHIPMWGVRTLAEAWEIVQAAGAENGGIVFDSLHFVRSHSKLDTLASIPGDRIGCVQLSDGPLTLDPGISLEANCFQRLWPGEGEFPLVEIVRTLKRTGGLRYLCAEVFSAQNARLSASEIAALSKASIERVLQDANPVNSPVATHIQ